MLIGERGMATYVPTGEQNTQTVNMTDVVCIPVLSNMK